MNSVTVNIQPISLDNCLSVARCAIGVVTSELNAQLVSKQGHGSDRKTLPEDIIRLIAPRAYIFGFAGLETPKDFLFLKEGLVVDSRDIGKKASLGELATQIER